MINPFLSSVPSGVNWPWWNFVLNALEILALAYCGAMLYKLTRADK